MKKFDFIYEVCHNGKSYIKSFHPLPLSASVKDAGESSVPGLKTYHATEKGLKDLKKLYPNHAYGDKQRLSSNDLVPHLQPPKAKTKSSQFPLPFEDVADEAMKKLEEEFKKKSSLKVAHKKAPTEAEFRAKNKKPKLLKFITNEIQGYLDTEKKFKKHQAKAEQLRESGFLEEIEPFDKAMDDGLYSMKLSVESIAKNLSIAPEEAIHLINVYTENRLRFQELLNTHYDGMVAKVEKKPHANKSPEKRAQAAKAGAKGMMKSMLTKGLRGDYKNASQSKVLEIAQRFQNSRTKSGAARDEKGDSKKRLSPTPENLVRWMNNPGGFDLIGVDTYKKGDATANLKIKLETWWNAQG